MSEYGLFTRALELAYDHGIMSPDSRAITATVVDDLIAIVDPVSDDAFDLQVVRYMLDG